MSSSSKEKGSPERLESQDKTVSRLVVPLRHMGDKTREIVRVLMEGSSSHSLNAKTISKLTGIKESTVRKVLSRLYKRGLIERECRGFYGFNHYSKVLVENWDTSAWKVHGVELEAFEPGLWGRLLEAGQLTYVEAGNLSRYESRTPLGRLPFQIFPSGRVVLQLNCPAVDPWLVDHMARDLQLGVSQLTRGLVPRIPTYLNGFEATFDVPAEGCPDFPREVQYIKIYRKEQGGKAFIRTEVVFSDVHRLVPLDVPSWSWITEKTQQALSIIPKQEVKP